MLDALMWGLWGSGVPVLAVAIGLAWLIPHGRRWKLPSDPTASCRKTSP